MQKFIEIQTPDTALPLWERGINLSGKHRSHISATPISHLCYPEDRARGG